MIITIIGLGLIGGSIALDLRSQLCLTVYGVDAFVAHQREALNLGLVDEIMSLEEGVSLADVIILATPVDTIETLLPTVLDKVKTNGIVMDVGSTKSIICEQIKNHPARGRFVAAHPLAGTEYSGPTAALRGLFAGKKNIICDKEQSDTDAIDTASKICESLGLTTYFMDSKEHDRHLAYVSHLSHVTSFALGLTVLNIEKDEKQIFNLAGTGFESTARLAKSNPDTWAAIFDKNQEYLTEALDGYIDHLQKFRKAIANRNVKDMKAIMAEANNLRKVLNPEKN